MSAIDNENMSIPITVSEQLLYALKPLIGRLQALAETDPVVRHELRHLGETLLALAAEPSAALAASAVQDGLAEATTATEEHPAEALMDVSEAPLAVAAQPDSAVTTPARLNGAVSRPPAPGKPYTTLRTTQEAVLVYNTEGFRQSSIMTTLDLSVLAQRCVVKKEGALWAAQRQRYAEQGIRSDTDLDHQRMKLIEYAQALPDCYLWMCQREGPPMVDAGAFEELAGCFDATMAIVLLLNDIINDEDEGEDFLEPALTLAGEAQAMLRNAVSAVNGTVDSDQVKLFQWLKATTNYYRIYIRDFMSKWTAVKPETWTDLKTRITELATRIEEMKQTIKQREKLFSKVRHRRRVIQSATGQELLEDWQRLVEAVNGLIESGLPPSSTELREQLLPVLDQMPGGLEVPRNFQLVLREIDRFLAKRTPSTETVEATTPIAEVLQVRSLLRDQTVVLIGGERRQAAANALCTAFELRELIWIEGHDQTYTDFEPQVARPEVSVVLLAIRWSRHGFGEVKEFCDRYDKPFVRLLGGYNPNQVAHTILNQIGQRLLQPVS
jgi:hypothetical protein